MKEGWNRGNQTDGGMKGANFRSEGIGAGPDAAADASGQVDRFSARGRPGTHNKGVHFKRQLKNLRCDRLADIITHR